ncbi:unnamed protein product [Chilo suppressalis]|uniref:Cytochrome P450 n=1 Tax=Chilo suppressalis TaxID=168631 RepID=A0ABN8BDF4_CHISP|nr:hypothetical protein evm_007814 [Chilo suppressalis]CAH0407553.1 unnamed protein product [Chilo suppressalis]
MLWQLFLICLLIWILVVRWQNRGKREVAKYLKNNIGNLPFLGIGHKFIGSDEDRMTTFRAIAAESNRNDGITSFWLGNHLFVTITDPVEAEAVLKNCLEKDSILRFVKALIGNGSIFAPVSIWRPRRKVLAPTFGLRNLNQFVNVFSEQSNIMADRLAEASDKGTFSIWKYMTSYTMDSVGETTMGTKLGIQKQDNHPFLVKFERLAELVVARTLMPWLHTDFIYKFTPYYKISIEMINYMTSFVRKIIKEKRKAIEDGSNKKDAIDEQNNGTGRPATKCLLELLIDYSGGDKGYTDLELQEETMVMLLAGTDTTAVGASFVMVMLSKHQDVQEKVYQEVLEVMGDEERPVSAEDLPRFKYLDAVVKETLRLYPPVPITARETDKDYVLPSGRKIVKGTGVIIHIWGTHRNPKYWGPDVEVFRPERFFDLQLAHPAAYMPFSYGPRNCLGYQYATMSMKTAVATLVRRYKVLPAEYIVQDGDKPLRVKYDFMMKHVDNFQVQLVRRK